MKYSEMLKLALKGYKPSEIAELQQLEKGADSEEDVAEVVDDPEEEVIEEPKEPEEEPEKIDENTDKKPENTLDYKALYEESMKKLTELQQKNIQQNIAGKEKSDDEVMASLLHKFIK